MPFKGQEDALLEARKAFPLTQLVTFWFLVGYKLIHKTYHTPMSRTLSLNACNDFLLRYQFLRSGKKIVWDYTHNDEQNLYRLFETILKTMDRTCTDCLKSASIQWIGLIWNAFHSRILTGIARYQWLSSLLVRLKETKKDYLSATSILPTSNLNCIYYTSWG